MSDRIRVKIRLSDVSSAADSDIEQAVIEAVHAIDAGNGRAVSMTQRAVQDLRNTSATVQVRGREI